MEFNADNHPWNGRIESSLNAAIRRGAPINENYRSNDVLSRTFTSTVSLATENKLSLSRTRKEDFPNLANGPFEMDLKTGSNSF